MIVSPLFLLPDCLTQKYGTLPGRDQMIRRNSVWAAVALCVVGVTAVTWNGEGRSQAEDKKKEPPKKSAVMQAFMKAKLVQAQGILEGLTVEDFDQIERNATAMFLLTKAEQWNASKDPQFIQHSKEFERATTQLAKYARDKNLDGASLMYVQLTLNCIECHRFVRDKAIQSGG